MTVHRVTISPSVAAMALVFPGVRRALEHTIAVEEAENRIRAIAPELADQVLALALTLDDLHTFTDVLARGEWPT